MRKHPTFRCPRHFFLLSMAALLSFLFLLLLLPPSPSADSPPPLQVRQACRATSFTSSCESTLSNSPDLTPLGLTLAALSASSAALPTARSLAQSILSASSSNPNRSNAARNCLEHLSLSDRRLSAAAAALSSGRAADARAWASAALLYQYDCNNGLSYVTGTRLVADAMAFLSSLYDLTSNALSFIAARQRFGDDLSHWSPPQTERNGYWGDPAPTAGRRSANRIARGRLVRIRIKAGINKETLRIPFEKTNVILIGGGIGATVITGSLGFVLFFHGHRDHRLPRFGPRP